MPRAVELQAADGTPLAAFDFGTVLPGTSSAPVPIRFKNTGTVAVNVKVWVENAASTDGTLNLSFGGGIGVTALTEADAEDLGILPAGLALAATVSYVVPAGSQGVMQARSVLKFKYG
ncbi:hypothetical protein [Deinococcus humi]|uniref:Uncharacterized protein n=1 Tax=Deinococcus humi TaxID=662880 RepID=A0A7W8JUV7_9DEIO|nr:hypothetical protein [Deinococcus humi]MBB5362064.1 hypothetical protein [Deinococcus humi]GGO22257.1 hypothetical protein GCM10008949_09310 [Deinococcus humi]